MQNISLEKEEWRVIGVMSGTSLDGLDLAYCTFRKSGINWEAELGPSITIEYDEEWTDKLGDAASASGSGLAKLHVDFGRYIARSIDDFLRRHQLETPDLIASHGHTVFHRPDEGYTLQIGSGQEIASQTGILTVFDFRTQDVALGGQGAPLVPVGDRLLFGKYDACINIGGFSNISFEHDRQRLAYDIGPANILLNHFSRKAGLPYDKDGLLAQSGNIKEPLLNELNGLAYYRQNPPKSLGVEWLDEVVFPVLKKHDLNERDMLRTLTEHAAIQIVSSINKIAAKTVMVTGGGAFNNYLMDRIRNKTSATIEIPPGQMVAYKEAMIFGLLGLLRVLGQPNTLRSVTGASKDHSAGVVAFPC